MFYGALNVLTNLAYLLPAYLAFTRRLFAAFGWFIAAFLVSTIFHLCAGTGICDEDTVSQLRHVDHIVAYIAVAQAILIIANYDLVPRSRIGRHAIPGASVDHTRAVALDDQYVLVKNKFSDVAAAIYVATIIVASTVWFDTPWEYLIIISLGVVIVALSYALHWREKRVGLKLRFLWPVMAAALLSAILAAVVFLQPDPSGRYVHPLWHLQSAVTATLLVLGSTAHLRVFALSDLWWTIY